MYGNYYRFSIEDHNPVVLVQSVYEYKRFNVSEMLI